MKLNPGIYLVLLFISCLSCNDENIGEKVSNAINIKCDVNILQQEFVRGIPIESATDTAFNSIGIMGYQTDVLFENAPQPKSSFFANTKVSKNAGNKWMFDHLYYWPQTGYISFFAYSPYADQNNGIEITAEQVGPPSLSYTLPQTVEDQPDLMIATPKMNLFKTDVELNFSHALACISFVASGPNVPIEYIGIKGIYTTGELSLNMQHNKPV